MEMRNAYPLLIAFLLATPHLRPMEMEEDEMKTEEQDMTKLLPAELQVHITSYLEDELLQPKIVTKWYSWSPVNALSYDPDGEHIATGDSNGHMQIRFTEDGRVKTEWNTGSDVWALCFAPDGEYVATGHEDGQVQIHSTKDGTVITEWNAGYVYALGFAPDSEYVATGHEDGQVQIHSTKDGTVITEWDTGSWVYALGFAPNGEYVATGDYNGHMQIRSTKDGTVITEWGTGSWVHALDFAPNGNSVATGHSNGHMQIRSTNGSLITEWGTGSWVHALDFAPDGNSVATGDKNGVQIWNILPVLAAHACQKKGLTIRQLVFLKELKINKTNKPLYLNADGWETFKLLCETDEDGEKKPGIDDFYTLYKLKANDAEPDESKKQWRIVAKIFYDRDRFGALHNGHADTRE